MPFFDWKLSLYCARILNHVITWIDKWKTQLFSCLDFEKNDISLDFFFLLGISFLTRMVETLNCTIISCHQTYVVSKLVTIREKILKKTVQFEYSYVYWERESQYCEYIDNY